MASTSPEPSAAGPASPATQDAATPNVAIDTDSYSADSAYDSELASYTTSLASGVTDYKQEHGRRYHAFKEGKYHFPNDEKEMDRLDVMHKLIETALDGKLYRAPIKDPKRILDVGTGTGIWAMEMGDAFEQCDILGNDLSPIQPRWVPPNVRFEVDDIEADWTFGAKFDFVHCRCMYSSIRDWPRLVGQVREGLAPGGWAEFVDYELCWRSPDGSLEGTTAQKVNRLFLETFEKAGLDPCPGLSLEKWVKAEGFEEVQARSFVVPVGTWPADKKLKEVGAWNYLQTMEGLESFFTAVFTRMLGYRKEEVDVMCAETRNNFKDPKVHAYMTLYDVYGRKPAEKDAKSDIDAAAAATKNTVAPEATAEASKEGTEAPKKEGAAPGDASAAAPAPSAAAPAPSAAAPTSSVADAPAAKPTDTTS